MYISRPVAEAFVARDWIGGVSVLTIARLENASSGDWTFSIGSMLVLAINGNRGGTLVYGAHYLALASALEGF